MEQLLFQAVVILNIFLVGLGITRAVELEASFEGFSRRRISARSLTNTNLETV